MVGYQLMAESYRKYLEKHPDEPNRESIENKIRINDFMAGCKEEDRYEMYDSGLFNDITRAYCERAMKKAGISKKKITEILENICILHDLNSAEEMCKKE